MGIDCGSPPRLYAFFFRIEWLEPQCLFDLAARPPELGYTSAFQLQAYLAIFLLTCVLELPIYLWAIGNPVPRWSERLRANLTLNLATHPAVFFLIPRWVAAMGGSYGKYLLLAESFAPSVEAALLYFLFQNRGLSLSKALATSVAANLFSWWIGGALLAGWWNRIGWN